MRIRSKGVIKAVFYVLLSSTVLVCIGKWDVWFGNITEPSYASCNVPARIQLTFGNDGRYSRNVSWQCGDLPVSSYLLFVKTGTTDTVVVAAVGKMLQTKGGRTVMYHAKMTNLSEGEYRYSVCTDNRQSDWYGFTVSADDDFRFVFIGDIQDTIGSVTSQQFSAVNRIAKDAAFWILGGDIIERPHDAYWNEYFTTMDSIALTKPIIACPGNHEYIKGLASTLDERFVHHFSYLNDSRTAGHAVFETRYGQVALITLDSNRDSWTLPSQSRWLEKALQNASDARWKIVVLHHPVFSIRGNGRHFFIRRLFTPLFERYGVDLVLQGHEHCYARKITGDASRNLTTPVFLISQFSPKDYSFMTDHHFDRMGNGKRFYQIIDITSDTLTLKAFTEHDELYDHIRIVRTGNDRQVTDLATELPEHVDLQSPRMR